MSNPPDSFELFINEQRAELAFFRITMTTLLIRLIASNPATAEERLQDMKSSVMGAISRMQTDPNDIGSSRMQHLVASRGEQFFGDLEELILQVRTTSGEAGKH